MPKRDNGWIYIAASVAGFILIAGIFFFQSEEAIDVPRKVVIENNAIVPQKDSTIKSISPALPQIKENAAIAEAAPDKESHPSKPIHQTQSSNSIITQKPSPAVNQMPSPSLPDQQSVAQVQIISQKPNRDLAPAIADELPAVAASDQKSNQKVRVNASALLSEVDGELETSFREKVIRTYKTAKVALANRNTINQ